MSESAPIEHLAGLTSGDLIDAEEPLRLFAAWFEQATRSEPRDPTAMSLATVDTDGLPNVRMVLMKAFGEAPAPCADRRLGQQAVGAARESARLREGNRVVRCEIRNRYDSTTAELDRLPPATTPDRVLARAAV